jgi:alpha-glucosidase
MAAKSIFTHVSALLASVALGGTFACGSDTGDPTVPPNNGSGGAASTGGSSSGGSSGAQAGGASNSGGSSTQTGGMSSSGGNSTQTAGASNTGGNSTQTAGASNSGGSSTQTGGTSSSGGSGGAQTGGASTGGVSSGGAPSSGGSATGGSGGRGGAGGSAGKGGNGGGNAGSGGRGGTGGTSTTGGTGTWCQAVGAVPSDLRTAWKVNTFYQKYTNANGIPILSSSAPSDRSLILACQLVVEMVSKRDDVRLALIKNKTFFAMLGTNEKTTQIPEYTYLGESINDRARGLGGNPGLCSEEGILCGPSDRWKGESICVHEFAHTISIYGLYDADPTFENRLKAAYNAARSAGRFANTYAMENEQEYWGEGVQDWYYTNLESSTPNGVHGPIDKREELRDYDRALHDLVGELLPTDVKWDDCYRDG